MVTASPPGTLSESATAAYQRIALQLHHDLPRAGRRRMALVTTANASQPAALCGLTLALELARELQQPVLCVDAHLRRGDASRALGCDAAQGVSDLLHDAALEPQALCLPTSEPLLQFLPAGVAGRGGARRSPEQVERVMAAVGAQHDFVVLIGGPVLDDTTALAVAPYVDCVLLVAFEDQTLLADLDQAQRALRACGAKGVRLVIADKVR